MSTLGKLNTIISHKLKMRMMRHGDLYEWQINPTHERSYKANRVPVDAKQYLRPTNPRLRALRTDYGGFDLGVTTPVVWFEGKLTAEELCNFRGHNPFLNQLSGLNYNELSYTLTYYALKASGAADLLSNLVEDGLFGVHTFYIDNRQVSRDLLDSVGEIDFIRRHLGLEKPSGINIIDIGAGYGRLAHRLEAATGQNVQIFATDAFPTSTFICEFYLAYRKTKRTKVIPLNEVESLFRTCTIDLAINVHSFSECSLSAIDWWAARLAMHRVRHLMVIPNQIGGDGQCLTNTGENFERILEQYGYEIRVREPRYADPAVQKYAVDPSYMNLFELAEEPNN